MAILRSKQRAGHAAGIFSDMTLDGPEIGTLVVVVDRAKNLPNRKTMGKQDPYCAMRLAKEAKKTNTDRRGGQTPKWDQELRFTVHDSPDYYKLKCSIFNDDKKTELISEAYVDLTDVVKLGGGQSDCWQQLSYKGKYAGDIRIELTFYDTRERPQEKTRPQEVHQTQPTDTESDMSLPQRSLGPRNVRRRPLPSSPADYTLSDVEPAAPQLPPQASLDNEEPQGQDYIQPVHAPTPTRPQNHLQNANTDMVDYDAQLQYPQDQYQLPSQAGPYQQPQPYHPAEQQSPWQYPSSTNHRDYQSDRHDSYDLPDQPPRQDYPPVSAPTPQYRNEEELWLETTRRPQSIHMHSDPVTPHHLAHVYRPSPTSANSDGQLSRFTPHQKHDQSVYAQQNHLDSPLRQSMSHIDMLDHPGRSDVPPPRPPKHRETTPKRPRSEYPPSAYAPQPLRLTPKRSSVSDRSPLQSLEDDYSLQRPQQLLQDAHPPQRHSMYVQVPAQRFDEHDEQAHHYGRKQSYDPQPHMSMSHVSQQRPSQGSRRSSYEIRHPSFTPNVVDEPGPMTPHDRFNVASQDLYQPTVEDAPPSPGLQPAVARKPVGTNAKRLNALPFGPDAYDVLNPASSPITNENTLFETPEQAKEARRLREIEDSRDHGPIIGNDGREIDPSDHLPCDTWAPEPERKQRKPEHVIHIRSKNGAGRPAGARSSPVVIRHNGGTMTSTQTSPAPSLPASSPAARTTPNSSIGGRNRLQKPMPSQTRPLPNQPYSSPAVAANSTPALASSSQPNYQVDPHFQPRTSQNRRPSFDNRVPNHLTRPPLSEYQVPVGNSMISRTEPYDPYNAGMMAIDYKPYETPTKQPPQPYHYNDNYSSPATSQNQRNSYDNRRKSFDRRNSYDNRSDYSYENHPEAPGSIEQPQKQQQQYFEDPLAAEMSMIDIGPSRTSYHQGSMGRSMVRRW